MNYEHSFERNDSRTPFSNTESPCIIFNLYCNEAKSVPGYLALSTIAKVIWAIKLLSNKRNYFFLQPPSTTT